VERTMLSLAYSAPSEDDMPRRVLLPLGVDEASNLRLDFAGELAEVLGARLIALANDSASEERPLAAALAAHALAKLAGEAGAIPKTFDGDLWMGLRRWAFAADMLVVDQPRLHPGHDRVEIEDLIRSCARPVVVRARTDRGFSAAKVVVAWNDSRECRRALADAAPFLVQAEDVLIMTAVSDRQLGLAAELDNLCAMLRNRRVKARWTSCPREGRSVAETILAAGDFHAADLIVAGAYGRRGLKRAVFGSTTDELMLRCDRPLLLSH